MKYIICFLGWTDVVVLAILIVLFIWYRFEFDRKIKNTFLWDVYDIGAGYIQFVILHRWNKVDERGFRFLETAQWNNPENKNFSKVRNRLFIKLKKINKGVRTQE